MSKLCIKAKEGETFVIDTLLAPVYSTVRKKGNFQPTDQIIRCKCGKPIVYLDKCFPYISDWNHCQECHDELIQKLKM